MTSDALEMVREGTGTTEHRSSQTNSADFEPWRIATQESHNDITRRRGRKRCVDEGRGRSDFELEAAAELAAAEGGDGECAAVELADDPFFAQGKVEQSGAEGAGDMGATLGPVETGEGEATALLAGGGEIDAEVLEGAAAIAGEHVVFGGTRGVDPTQADEAVVQGDGGGSGHVVVAAASGAEVDRRGGREGAAHASGDDAEAFEGASDSWRGEGVVAMAALLEDADEMVAAETAEVDAGGGRRDPGDDGQLSAGAGFAFHQAIEHARARRLADGGGDAGDGGVDGSFCRHSFTVIEVWTKNKGEAGS